MASGMCLESNRLVSGSPIRLESCVKGRVEVAWSHVQVSGNSSSIFISLITVSLIMVNNFTVSVYEELNMNKCKDPVSIRSELMWRSKRRE